MIHCSKASLAPSTQSPNNPTKSYAGPGAMSRPRRRSLGGVLIRVVLRTARAAPASV